MGWAVVNIDLPTRQWVSITSQLTRIGAPNVSFHHYISPAKSSVDCQITHFQLHIFSYASQQATTTAVYLPIDRRRHDLFCFHVFNVSLGASRLSLPTSLWTDGCCNRHKGSQISRWTTALSLSLQTLWTDTRCALDWVASSKQQPVITSCLKKIYQATMLTFFHVFGACNPTDLPTRGMILNGKTASCGVINHLDYPPPRTNAK